MSPSNLISLFDTFPKDCFFSNLNELLCIVALKLCLVEHDFIIDMCMYMYFETDISSRKLMPQIIAPTVVNAQPLSLNVKETKNIFNYELSSFLFFSFFIQNLVFRFLFFVIQISSNYECFFTVLLLQRPYKLQICQTIFLCMKLKG